MLHFGYDCSVGKASALATQRASNDDSIPYCITRARKDV